MQTLTVNYPKPNVEDMVIQAGAKRLPTLGARFPSSKQKAFASCRLHSRRRGEAKNINEQIRSKLHLKLSGHCRSLLLLQLLEDTEGVCVTMLLCMGNEILQRLHFSQPADAAFLSKCQVIIYFSHIQRRLHHSQLQVKCWRVQLTLQSNMQNSTLKGPIQTISGATELHASSPALPDGRLFQQAN